MVLLAGWVEDLASNDGGLLKESAGMVSITLQINNNQHSQLLKLDAFKIQRIWLQGWMYGERFYLKLAPFLKWFLNSFSRMWFVCRSQLWSLMTTAWFWRHWWLLVKKEFSMMASVSIYLHALIVWRTCAVGYLQAYDIPHMVVDVKMCKTNLVGPPPFLFLTCRLVYCTHLRVTFKNCNQQILTLFDSWINLWVIDISIHHPTPH